MVQFTHEVQPLQMPLRGADVHQIIRRQIIYLKLPPGEHIREAELSERLHVSRTPVREALIRLADEMLVQIFPQRGIYVTKIDMEYVRQLMFMRNTLDASILTELSRQRPALQEQFASHMFLLDCAAQERDPIAYIKADVAFHSKLYSCARYPLLWDSLCRSHNTRYRMLDLSSNREKLTQLQKEHELILQYIELGDEARLREILTQHNDPNSVRQAELMKRFPHYFGSLDVRRMSDLD